MPTVLRDRGYRFFFFSNEASEPPHVHVKKGEGHAKLWLATGALETSRRLNPSQLRTIRAIVNSNMVLLREAWNEHFDR